MMILRLSAQGAFFFHSLAVALAIVAIAEGKLAEIWLPSRNRSSHGLV
jgi:hypothetical protein